MGTQIETVRLAPNVVKLVNDAVDAANDELRRINLELWNNPEVMFKEVKACKLLSDFLESRGWTVKRGVYGLETAFEARIAFVGGGRTVCYNVEYDALPDIGHACGHNLIATASLASAIGTAHAIETLGVPGAIIVVGTPAEETGGGKYIMANNGAWRDCDVCLMTHAMQDYSTPVLISRASWKFRATFHGRPSHAAYAPWNGRNACDAIVLAYNGLACLRQQIVQRTETIQSVILEAGKAPNVIPDYAAGTYSIRAKDAKALEALRERVIPIFEGAAAATGCTVKLYWDALYEDVITNSVLATHYQQDMIEHLGMPPHKLLPLDEAFRKEDKAASSDFGNCTYIVPGIQSLFSINAADMPHTPPFREAAGTSFAHDEAIRAGKANALLGVRVLMHEAFFRQVREEWEATMREAGRM